MEFIKYINSKFNTNDSKDLIGNGVKYLAGSKPAIDNLLGYRIIDNWIKQIEIKWNVEYREMDVPEEKLLGKLEPKRGGFIININSHLPETTKRFVIAHELAHIISYEIINDIPRYNLIHSWNEELFCDQVARAILMPSSLFKPQLINLHSNNSELFDELKKLKFHYKVSIWQIILRLLDESFNNNIIGIFWKFYHEDNCLRIVDYNKNKPKNIFIPLSKSIKISEPSKINFSPLIAFKDKRLFQGEDFISIGSIYKKKLFCSTFPHNNISDKFVIQLINLKELSTA